VIFSDLLLFFQDNFIAISFVKIPLSTRLYCLQHKVKGKTILERDATLIDKSKVEHIYMSK